MASPEVMAAVIPGGNGIFRSTVVLNGQVKATWKRTVKKARVDVQVLLLGGWRRRLPCRPGSSRNSTRSHASSGASRRRQSLCLSFLLLATQPYCRLREAANRRKMARVSRGLVAG